ncbi:hypothetical protein BRC88_14040 [Halobacteriales archaeon QS_4_69_225]|nr:MAG: hypothetical protein BRC88_14040 [Halobacteriales archaeon QS_4_69_225]
MTAFPNAPSRSPRERSAPFEVPPDAATWEGRSPAGRGTRCSGAATPSRRRRRPTRPTASTSSRGTATGNCRRGRGSGVVIASDDDDYVRHDPTDRSTNELVLGESALRFEGVAEGVDAPSFPDASPSATIDSETYTGGQTAQ